MKAILLFLFSSIAAYSQTNINILLGQPDTLGFIIHRPQYVVSYSSELNTARWVSWHIDKACYGNVKRFKGNFKTDTTLLEHYANIRHSDYTNSGYDRGHLVRSEERTATVEDNISTFFLTNIIPQVPELNRNVWLKLENYCKKLCVKENKLLFVVAGGKHSANPNRINGKIAISDSCWKVILILDSGKSIKDIDSNTQTIAVMMPNHPTVKKNKNTDWTDYLTNIDHIENSTGFDFFSIIEDKIEAIIEKKEYREK